MKTLPKYILWLTVIGILIIPAGLILTTKFKTGLNFTDIIILSASFAILALVTLVIFFRGQKKDSAGQTIYTLIAMSIKFITELIIALLWFFVAKKTGVSAVILFFILYLAFTLFSISVVLKTLKYKQL